MSVRSHAARHTQLYDPCADKWRPTISQHACLGLLLSPGTRVLTSDLATHCGDAARRLRALELPRESVQVVRASRTLQDAVRSSSAPSVVADAAHALLLALLRSLAAVTKSNGFGETVAAMATLSAATAGEALYDTARSCQLASCIAAISLGCVRMSQAAQTMQLKSWDPSLIAPTAKSLRSAAGLFDFAAEFRPLGVAAFVSTLAQSLSQLCLAQSQQLAAYRGLQGSSGLRALGRVALWCAQSYASLASTVPQASVVATWKRSHVEDGRQPRASLLLQLLGTLQAFTFFQAAALESAGLQLIAVQEWHSDSYTKAIAFASIAAQRAHRCLNKPPLAVDGHNERLGKDSVAAKPLRDEYAAALLLHQTFMQENRDVVNAVVVAASQVTIPAPLCIKQVTVAEVFDPPELDPANTAQGSTGDFGGGSGSRQMAVDAQPALKHADGASTTAPSPTAQQQRDLQPAPADGPATMPPAVKPPSQVASAMRGTHAPRVQPGVRPEAYGQSSMGSPPPAPSAPPDNSGVNSTPAPPHAQARAIPYGVPVPAAPSVGHARRPSTSAREFRHGGAYQPGVLYAMPGIVPARIRPASWAPTSTYTGVAGVGSSASGGVAATGDVGPIATHPAPAPAPVPAPPTPPVPSAPPERDETGQAAGLASGAGERYPDLNLRPAVTPTHYPELDVSPPPRHRTWGSGSSASMDANADSPASTAVGNERESRGPRSVKQEVGGHLYSPSVVLDSDTPLPWKPVPSHVTSTSVTISWSAVRAMRGVDATLAQQVFEVQWKRAGARVWSFMPTPVTGTTATKTMLSPATQYVFRVGVVQADAPSGSGAPGGTDGARGDDGAGDERVQPKRAATMLFSMASDPVRTLPAPPPAAGKVTAFPVDSEEVGTTIPDGAPLPPPVGDDGRLQLHWKWPRSDGGSPIDGFIVTVRRAQGHSWCSVQPDGTVHTSSGPKDWHGLATPFGGVPAVDESVAPIPVVLAKTNGKHSAVAEPGGRVTFTLRGLVPGTRHRVCLRCHNALGYGDASYGQGTTSGEAKESPTLTPAQFHSMGGVSVDLTAEQGEALAAEPAAVDAMDEAKASADGHHATPELDIEWDSPRHKLGEGGFGSVYRSAIGGFHGETVAVKELSGNAGMTQISALLAEINLLKKLHHPGLVNILGYSVKPTRVQLVIELMQGGSWYDALHCGDRPAQEWTLRHKLQMAAQVAAAVEYLHTRPQPVIHRDLKPQNVLLNEDHTVAKVCDFGLAITRQASVVMTRAAGTYEYIAPEAFKSDQPFTEKVDVYAFAVLLNELLTGNAPWAGLQMYQVTMAVAIEKRRPSVVVGVPFEVSRLVLEGWRHHAAGRPTMTHMRQVLERVLAHDVPESDNVDNGDGKDDDHT